jgi:hypothetical protein
VGEYPASVAIRDIDGDGVMDIMPNGCNENMSILRKVGRGAFNSTVPRRVVGPQASVAIGDLNGEEP